MKHPHAELMAQYAQDALETDKPWERWEYMNLSLTYVNLRENPTWNVAVAYRRKPKPYEPTLLDQALELEIEAMMKRATHYGSNDAYGIHSLDEYARLKSNRSPAMIEHLKSQGKL